MKGREKGGFRMKGALWLGALASSWVGPPLKVYAAGADSAEDSFFFPLATSPMAVYFILFFIFWGIVQLAYRQLWKSERKGPSYEPHVAAVLAAIVWFVLFAIDVWWL